MKNIISILLIFIVNSTITAQKDEVTIQLGKLMKNPHTIMKRNLILDSAAACQARYLVKNRLSGHSQPEGSGLETPRKRAQHFGDSTFRSWYEVAWSGDTIWVPNNVKAAIFNFKSSAPHWYIMTEAIDRGYQVNFGFARIRVGNFESCVILYCF